MKKFLIFLVTTIVAVCIGMTFYQFAKNDEVIKVDTQTIYVNYGDKLSLDDIGFSRKDASKDTKINFNAGGDEVTSIIQYDPVTQCYIPTKKGGATTIKISTTNRKYKTLTVDVVVGVGTEENPFYISTEDQLFNIGNVYDLGSCFELVNDIEVKESHLPIGLIDGKYNEFTGVFNGGYHTISNLKIETCDNAGLFATLASNSSVYNLNISNAVLEGSFLNVGTLAGICYGNINKIVIANSTINNTRASSNTGAVVGALLTDKTKNITASMLRTAAYTDQNNTITAKGNLGGLAGLADSAVIHACYTNLNLINTIKITGGLVGHLIVDSKTYIYESYSISTIKSIGSSGNIVGKISISSTADLNSINQELVLVGLYYDNTLNTFSGVGEDSCNFETVTNFAITGKTTAELKSKSTYIYYIKGSNDVMYWDDVWSLVDGQFPTLTFVSKFDEVKLENEGNTTAPSPETPDISNPDITDPESPSKDTSAISTKQDLIDVFQAGKTVTGKYVLSNDIDLEGMTWNPINFAGKFVSDNDRFYTISNFKIASSSRYVGFFSALSSAHIENIKFKNVKIPNEKSVESAGIVVGYISGNTTIKGVDVSNSSISAAAKYVGGIAGYVGKSVVSISNCLADDISMGTSSLNVGGIAGYIGENTTIKSSNVQSGALRGINRIGGIVAVNNGSITSCSSGGIIKSSSASSDVGYFGGLCAVNKATVSQSMTTMEISVLNNTDKTLNIYYYVGGLCGYNIGTLSYCSAYSDQISGNNASSATHIGGLVGYNKGTIEYCLIKSDIIGETRANIYTGGLASYNYGGNIYGCCALIKNLNGYVVAGLVRVNTNKGTVDSCTSAGSTLLSRSNYTGFHVAAFTYDMVSGTISNCIVMSNLNCSYDSGWVAGFAGYMPYSNGTFGTITTCISDVSLNGEGDKFLDLVQDGLMKKERTTGTIANCVLSQDAVVEGVIPSSYDNKFIFWGTATPGSGSYYIVANSKEMTNIETYLDTKKCSFDIIAGDLDSKWIYYNTSRLPMPRAIEKIFNDIAG